MKPTHPPRPRNWRRTLLELAVIALVFLGIRAWTSRGAASGLAPPVEGQSITGQPLSLAAFAGEPVLVHFWATWCGVCEAEKGTIEALSRGQRVITIAEDSGSREQLSAYMAKAGLTFPVLNDDGRLARAYGVSAYPTSFIVGKSGVIRFSEVGFTTELGLRARLWLAGL